MKKTFSLFLAISTITFSSFAQINQNDESFKWFKKTSEVIHFQLNKAAKTYKPGKNPRSINPDGTVRLARLSDWTTGFFPGSLLYGYELTGDKKLAQEAKKFTLALDSIRNIKNTHDLGFMLYCSYGNGYRLTNDKIISIFCLIDDILQGIEYKEDLRRRVSEREIIVMAIVFSTSFFGNHSSAIQFMKQYGYIPNMLNKSRFNRRLHKIRNLLYELFEIVSSYFKDFCCEMQYIIDSFPVTVCNNMRILNCKILKDKKCRGYTASMQNYFSWCQSTIGKNKIGYSNSISLYTRRNS